MSSAEPGLVAPFGTALQPARPAPVAPLPAPAPRKGDRWYPVLVFGALATALFVVVGVSVSLMDVFRTPLNWRILRDIPFLEGWVRWDAGWYWWIARHGYFLEDARQSPVAFFPGYPLVLQALSPYTGGPMLAGILVTLGSGMGVAVLFFRWCAARLGTAAARTGLLVLLCYPFAYYLVGAVYADALYLCAVLGAFLLLERGHPVLAGIVGALATATRPVGYALVLGLVLRSLERRGRPVMGRGPLAAPEHVPASRWAPAGVLISLAGLLAYSGWLWYRFGNPLAFISAQGEWGQPPGLATWSKQAALSALASFEFDLFHLRIVVHAALTIAAIALVPMVVRRLGWAYGAYAAATILVPTLTSADFVGLGRYMLAAFPCFAVAGLLLSERPRLRAVVLPLSLGLLLVFTSLFSRWNYVS